MKYAGAYLTAWGIEAVSGVAARLPKAQPAAHGVERIRNVPYRDTGSKWHTCDIYRPAGMEGPMPVVFYFHGGGFFSLSKDTHWLMGLIFARRGFLVMNFSYRLAPRHPYPAALEDASEAYAWGVEQASRWGGDVSKLVLAGESAGANLVVALTAASSIQRPEPFAERVRATGVHPSAVVPACGVFDVSGAKDLTEGRNHFIRMRLVEVEEYLLGGVERREPGGLELADPLCLLESEPTLTRELPPCFLPVGGHDPLVSDSLRLERAWKNLGGKAQMKSYPGQGHAFHAMIWREPARECWKDSLSFVANELDIDLLQVHGTDR